MGRLLHFELDVSILDAGLLLDPEKCICESKSAQEGEMPFQ
jgi:hypothetical protein